MKFSLLLLASLLGATPSLASRCKPSPPSPTSSVVSASSAPASSSSSVSSASPASSVSSTLSVSSTSSVSTSAAASSSSVSTTSSAVSSSSVSSSASAPSSSAPGDTNNAGTPTCSSVNLFVDADLSLGLGDWPSTILTGSPAYTLSTTCNGYAACLDIATVYAGGAEALSFHQKVAVVKGTQYTGYFHYRLPQLVAHGKNMVTLKCTLNGVTKYSKTLCDNEKSASWTKVDFAYTADCAEVDFQCKISTEGITSELQFADFYFAEVC